MSFNAPGIQNWHTETHVWNREEPGHYAARHNISKAEKESDLFLEKCNLDLQRKEEETELMGLLEQIGFGYQARQRAVQKT